MRSWCARRRSSAGEGPRDVRPLANHSERLLEICFWVGCAPDGRINVCPKASIEMHSVSSDVRKTENQDPDTRQRIAQCLPGGDGWSMCRMRAEEPGRLQV